MTYLSHLLYMNYLQDLAGQILIKLQFLASCNCKWANLKPWVCNEVVGNPHIKKCIAKLSRSFHLTCVWKILKRWWPHYPNTPCHLARTKKSSLNCQVVLNMLGKKVCSHFQTFVQGMCCKIWFESIIYVFSWQHSLQNKRMHAIWPPANPN